MALEIPELGYVMNEANKEDPKDIDEFSIFGGGGDGDLQTFHPFSMFLKSFQQKYRLKCTNHDFNFKEDCEF